MAPARGPRGPAPTVAHVVLRFPHLQRRPLKLVPALAHHVVAAAVLLDQHSAPGARLDAARQLVSTSRGQLVTLRKPPVLAHEAHDRLEAQVAQTDAVPTWAVYLQRLWVKLVPLQLEAFLQLFRQRPCCRRDVQHQGLGQGFPAAGPEAPESELPHGAALRQLRLDRSARALLASCMVTSRLPLSRPHLVDEQGAADLAAQGA
mmetsp:Transcript_75650/g.214048  ORF Transcript_75650/g.214048 Transcript_75650/m.214048 type:complete len:204 (-) Transcript_75650:57-668(-)